MTIHEPWRGLIADPMPRDHFVQVYRNERVLIATVSQRYPPAFARSPWP